MNPLGYGQPNPNAPKELSQFGFLIGAWKCDIKVKGEDGTYQTHKGSWAARYILDGYVIVDEFRQTGPNGELVRLGTTYRSYNSDQKRWVLKWLDALNSTWLDLGPEDLGGVQVTERNITFKHHQPPNIIVRITFSSISENHITWQADSSTDGGQTWEEAVMMIEADRA